MEDGRPAEELYDLKNDLYEVNNLAADKEYQKIKEKLRSVSEDWLTQNDFGNYPEDPGEIEYAEALMKRLFAKEMKKNGLEPNVSNEIFLDYWKKYLLQVREEK